MGYNKKVKKHIDLFSGIGGFALAVDRVWPGTEHIFCDFDPFCKQVLKKHWPKSKIYDDIRTIATDTNECGHLHGKPKKQSTKGHDKTQCESLPSIDSPFILTGGFPCQPFSQAGQRKGTDDNRYLWPEMFRVIRAFKPTWIIAENVRGLVTWNEGMVLEQVCLDLESEGYEVQPIIIPAVAVNAPHRRDRVWIIAHSRYGNGQGRENDRKSKGPLSSKEDASESERPNSDAGKGITPNAKSSRTRGDNTGLREESVGNSRGPRAVNSNTNNEGPQRSRQEGQGPNGQPNRDGSNEGSDWNKNWHEIATELCRVDDGLPTELDGFKLSKPAHRKQRLKSLGNAIVPQVAEQIMKVIDGLL
jgi:DNA (cytosine-5)-methyltransferase 1